jgi:hypothetical protein
MRFLLPRLTGGLLTIDFAKWWIPSAMVMIHAMPELLMHVDFPRTHEHQTSIARAPFLHGFPYEIKSDAAAYRAPRRQAVVFARESPRESG